MRADLEDTGLVEDIDIFVPSAQVGYRKPHPLSYQSVLALSGSAAEEAFFVGDNLNTDVLGPRKAGIRSVLLARVPVDTFHEPQAESLAALANS